MDPNGRELTRVLESAAVGDTLKVLIARDGRVRELSVKLKKDTKSAFVIRPRAGATDDQQNLGKIWLSLK